MINLEIDTIIREVKERLAYVAGKRAEDPEAFFRHSACSADDTMLKTLAFEAANTLTLPLILKGVKFRMEENCIVFEFPAKYKETDSIFASLRIALVNRILQLWLSLTGFGDKVSGSDEVTSVLIAGLNEILSSRSGLHSRSVPPI